MKKMIILLFYVINSIYHKFQMLSRVIKVNNINKYVQSCSSIVNEMSELANGMFERAVQQDGLVLRHIPRNRITNNICKLAIQQNYYSIKYVPECMKTNEICREVCREVCKK